MRTESTLITQPGLTVATIIAADALALLAAQALGLAGELLLFSNSGGIELMHRIGPFLPLGILVYLSSGLYHGVALSPPEELRRLSLGTTRIYFFLLVIFASDFHPGHLRLLVSGWAFSIVLVPFSRMALRALFARKHWWGHTAIIFGTGATARKLALKLRSDPALGLKPVALLGNAADHKGMYAGIPILNSLAVATDFADRYGVHYAVLAMPHVPARHMLSMIEQYGRYFSHLLVVPNLPGIASLRVEAREVAGLLGIEVRQRLLLLQNQLLKRAVDVIFPVVIAILILPIVILLYVAIRFTSRGPVLYGQKRLGHKGTEFKAWKFRSMVGDAEQVLVDYLAHNPVAREQWERDRKLRNDPRVTRLGLFIRKTSLDELPQLWNVFKGEMSLVGPRPIVAAEIQKYGEAYELYKKVKPGITGLWQISGRNNLSYEQRIEFDEYYVRNWSVWFDVYILIRTITVVLLRKGAY